MEEIELPVKKVDIIISEWMGYFLLYESMLDTVLWARDKYLAKNGKMLPDKAQIFVAAIEDEQFRNSKKNFWKNVYGVDMSVMTDTVLNDPLIDTIDSSMINSTECKIIDLNLVKMKPSDVEFSTTYNLTFTRNDKFHGLVAWFDTPFSNLEFPVNLSTSPYRKYTHWKQTTFYID